MIIALLVLATIGSIVVLVATVAALGMAYDAFLEWRREPHYRSFQEGCEHARNRMMNDAWWFSESPETMTLIQELARGVNVSDAREKWRKSRAEQEAPCS